MTLTTQCYNDIRKMAGHIPSLFAVFLTVDCMELSFMLINVE